MYKCAYCIKEYRHKQSKWTHEQKCKLINKTKTKDIINADLIAIEKMKLSLEIIKEEARILELKSKLEKSEKIDNITLKKLNRILQERNNRIKNSTINSHNTNTNIQNNITNNFQIIQLGKENIIDKLSPNEKKLIMNAKFCSLEKLIEIVHCGKYNQFKNIIITNMKDNYIYKYDDNKGQFILATKKELLNSLIDYRISDLEVIYNNLLGENKLDDKTKECIEKFINKIEYSESIYTDVEGNQHKNYKEYKINEIKLLLFNNQDKITNDISLLLYTDEK